MAPRPRRRGLEVEIVRPPIGDGSEDEIVLRAGLLDLRDGLGYLWSTGGVMRDKRTVCRALALMVLGAVICLAGLEAASARQAVLVPRPEDTRFQLISSEPIAGPDGRSHVPAWSVLVFRDRRADRCFFVFKREESIAVEPGAPCTP